MEQRVSRKHQELLKKTGLVTATLKNSNPQTMMFAYNTRKPFLQDRRTRQAIGSALDFDQLNHNQFYDLYTRGTSYFSGTQFASTGTPSAMELRWLKPWRQTLPADLFKKPFVTPGIKKGQNTRTYRGKALQLLKDAGWHIKDNQQVNEQGESLALSILLPNAENERTVLAFKHGLKALGIELTIRTVDTSQYIQRRRALDFDIIPAMYPHTPSPGTEQREFFGSEVADEHGTRNLAGVKNPVIDDLVTKIPAATSHAELQSLVQALDRVLLWEHYNLPIMYLGVWPLVYRNTLKHAEVTPPYALDLSSWWYEP